MGQDLFGKQVLNTYDALIKVGDNDTLTGTAKQLSDGRGNDAPIWLSTARMGIGITPDTNYTLTVNGAVKIGSLDVTGAITGASVQLTGGSGAQGTLSWNTDEETVDIIQNGATLQVGQETQVHVKNQTGSAIADGTPVYVTGTLGSSGRLTVAPMIADGTIQAKYFLGITTEDIPDGSDGKVTVFGKIRGLNTSAYSEGQTLYVSASTAGAFQTTAPVAPNLDLEVAIVINSHVNNGTIFVRAQNGHYLGLLHDVYLNSPANNQFLVYNSTNSRWENQGIASVGSINLDTVTDNGNTTDNDITVGDITAGNVTLSGYLRGAANFVIDPAAYGDETGVVQILGDLRVDGTTTTINSTTVTIDDKNLVLASGSATAADANGAGITIDGANATLTYASATDDFTFNKDLNVTSNISASNAITAGTLNVADAIIHSGDTDTKIEFLSNQIKTTVGETLAINTVASGTTFYHDVTAPTFIGALQGNADTASALETARNISISGAVTGNADFDGSGDITITTSVNHNHDADYVNVTGDTMTGNLNFSDSVKTVFGTDNDFTIQHNDTHAFLDNDKGAIFIRNFADDSDIILSSDDGSGSTTQYLRIDGSEGSVILYHYGSAKLETTSTGVSVTGALSGNIDTSSISGGTIDINGTTAINLQYNGSTQLRVDSSGVAYLGTVTFANDGISLTDEDSTIDSFFHANIDYDAGLYTVTSNARYGADYIQVDGLDSREETRFVISPKDIGDPDPHAFLYIGGDDSITAPNTLVDWHTIEMNALLVKLNANLNIQTGGLLVGGVSVINSSRNITANSFVKSGGTSNQFLKADGSVDSNVYATETDNNNITARALGWVPAYSNSAETTVYWNESEQAIELYSGGDGSIGMAYRAVRIKAGDKLRFTTMVKGESNNSDGLYLRLYAYHGDMPDGKTHVSNLASSSSPYVQGLSSGITNWVENGAITTSWVTYEYNYTAPADGYVSLVALNWAGYGTQRLYVKQPDIQFEKVNQATSADSADNADTLDTKHATDFTLDYVTDNGATTTNNIEVGIATASQFKSGKASLGNDGTTRIAIGEYTMAFGSVEYPTLLSNNHADLILASNLKIDSNHDVITINTHANMKGAGIVVGGNSHPNGTSTLSFYAKGGGGGTAGDTYTAESAEMVLTNTQLSLDVDLKLDSGNTLILDTHGGFEIDMIGAGGGNIRANDNLYLLSQTANTNIGASGTNSIFVVTSGTSYFTNNVGINATTANADLDVQGTALIGSGTSTRASRGLTLVTDNSDTFSANSDLSDTNRQFTVINDNATVGAYSAMSFRVYPSSGTAMADIKLVRAAGLGDSTLYTTIRDNNGNFQDIMEVRPTSVTVNGSVTATSFSGNGSSLTSVNASQLGGYSISNILSGNGAGEYIVHDTRLVETSTDLGVKAVRFDFKANGVGSLADGGSYHGTMTFQQWNDSSGGNTHTLAFTDSGNLYNRSTSIGGTWGSYSLIHSDANSGRWLKNNYDIYYLSGDVFVGGTTTSNAQGWGRQIASINSGSNGAALTLKDSNGEWQLASYQDTFRLTKGAVTAMKVDSSAQTRFYSSTDYSIGLTRSGNDEWWLKAYTNGAFAIHENGVGDKLYISAGGNTGIGTDSPSEKLEVAGNIKANAFGSEDSTYTRVYSPRGATYNGSASTTGMLTVILPQIGLNTMLKMTIRVFDYAQDESFDVQVAGYLYGNPNTYWTNISAYILASPQKDRNFTVRFGYNSVGKGCVFIGETASTWSYIKFGVIDAQFSHSQVSLGNWIDGWNTAVLSDTTGYTFYRTETDTQATNWKRNGQNLYYGSGTGSVGIGTTSPNAQLEISNTESGTGIGGASLRLTRSETTVVAEDPIGKIEFYNTDADGAHVSSFIKGVARETYGRKGALTFGVSTTNSTDAVEVMRIDENGRIGIGISPNISGVRLHTFNNSTNAYNIFESSNNKWVFGEAGGVCQIGGLYGVHSGMQIDTSGKVGVNTSGPQERFSVASGNIAINNSASFLVGGATGDTKIGRLGNTSGVLTLDGDGTRNIRLGSSTNGEVVRIDNTNQRVGIGTTSPDTKLHVQVSSGSALKLQNAVSTLYAEQAFQANDSSAYLFKGGSAFSSYGGARSMNYYNSDSGHYFHTNAATNILNITNAGNVGINTTPNYKLDVNGTINARDFIRVGGNSKNATEIEPYNKPSATSVNLGTYINDYAFIDLASSNGSGGWIDFSYANGGDYRGRIRYANSSDYFNFYAAGSGSPTMTMGNGRVGINNTSPSSNYSLDIAGRVNIDNGTSNALRIDTAVLDSTTRDAIELFENDAQATGRQAISWYNGNQAYYKARLWTEVGGSYGATKFGIDVANDSRVVATRLYIEDGDTYVSGKLTASNDVIAFSDERVKENIETIDNALDKVLSMRGVSYNRTDQDDKSKKVGVIAQEIEKVLPEVVTEDGEGMKGVAYGNIVGVLIEAIKEQQKQIDELKSRLDGSTN